MDTIFFDLDGTLTDPKEGIIGCIQHALAEMGEDVAAKDELLWCIGPSLWDSFEELLGGVERTHQAMKLYRERFVEIGMFENAVYENIPELLQALHDSGRRVCLATSKPHVYAGRILEHFKLDAYFDHVFGAELDGTRADKSDLLAYALKQSGALTEGAIMVGDRKYDIIGARANGMTAIGVLYGYGNRNELEQAKAHHIVEHPEDLLRLLL